MKMENKKRNNTEIIASIKKAIKILKSYKRLSEDRGVKLPQQKIDDIDKKIKEKVVKISDLPALLRREYPGQYNDKTLEELEEILKANNY
jgi:hypothetical protein